MRINELLIESEQLDEISLAGIGKGIGAAAGAIGRGVGNIKGAWQGAVDAYTQNRDRVAPIAQRNVARGGQAKPEQAAAPGTVQTPQSYGGAGEIAAPNLLARAQQGTTQDPALQGQQPPAQSNTANAQPAVSTPTAQPAAAPAADASNAQADQQAKIGVAQINKIIPSLRSRDLQSVKKNVDATIAKKSKQPAGQEQSAAQGQAGKFGFNTQTGKPYASAEEAKKGEAANAAAIAQQSATTNQQTATEPKPGYTASGRKLPTTDAEAEAGGFQFDPATRQPYPWYAKKLEQERQAKAQQAQADSQLKTTQPTQAVAQPQQAEIGRAHV